MSATGRCYCGEVRYSFTGPVMWSAQCHCRECQYITGGGPNYFLITSAADFSFSQGTTKQFTRADLEAPVTREFCDTCGTHLITRLADGARVVVKVGTLDDMGAYPGPSAAIYCCDKQPFHVIADGVPQLDRLPQR